MKTVKCLLLMLLTSVGTGAYGQRAGDRCSPPNAVAGGLVCARTNEIEVFEGYIANAKKGDVVLSADCGGMIGGLLRRVQPPQRFSHSGIMVKISMKFAIRRQ